MKYNPEIIAAYFRSEGIPAPEFEFRFHPLRKWRMDMAWIAQRVYLECDGGLWINGGHNRGAQMKKDWEKMNTASGMGWRILKCEPKDLCTQETVEYIRQALKEQNETLLV